MWPDWYKSHAAQTLVRPLTFSLRKWNIHNEENWQSIRRRRGNFPGAITVITHNLKTALKSAALELLLLIVAASALQCCPYLGTTKSVDDPNEAMSNEDSNEGDKKRQGLYLMEYIVALKFAFVKW